MIQLYVGDLPDSSGKVCDARLLYSGTHARICCSMKYLVSQCTFAGAGQRRRIGIDSKIGARIFGIRSIRLTTLHIVDLCHHSLGLFRKLRPSRRSARRVARGDEVCSVEDPQMAMFSNALHGANMKTVAGWSNP